MEDKVVATFSDRSAVESDYLVGADWIHSTVRGYIANVQPKYTHQTLVYGLVPTKDLPDANFASMAPTVGVSARTGFLASAFTDGSRSCLYWLGANIGEIAEKSYDSDSLLAEEYERFRHLYQPILRIIRATGN